MTKKTKVPKRLAGVKIPKTLRRGLKDLARSQSGKAVLADALAAAGAELAALEGRKGSRPRTNLADKAPRAKAKAKDLAAEARSWTGAGAFEDAARAFADSLKRAAPPEPAPTAETPAPTAQH